MQAHRIKTFSRGGKIRLMLKSGFLFLTGKSLGGFGVPEQAFGKETGSVCTRTLVSQSAYQGPSLSK